MSVLIPAEISEIELNFELLKNDIRSYMNPFRIEYIKNTSTGNLVIETGIDEWIIERATNGKRIGEGNCPMDILSGNNKGIDVMSLCLNSNVSNEKSLMQNFSNSGQDLDNLFIENKGDEAIKLYLDDYKLKLQNFSKKFKTEDIYLLAFLSDNESIYLTLFKIHIENLESVTHGGFTPKQKSLNINGFISDNYGTTKLYKSKKRLELRFKRDVVNNFNTVKIF